MFSPAIVVQDEFGQDVAVRYEGYGEHEGEAVEFPIVTKWDAVHKADNDNVRKLRIENNRINCFPTEFGRYRHKTLEGFGEDFDQNALAQAQMFITRVCHDTQGGLVLYGDSGVGKTSLAAAICNALIDQGRKCRMTSLSALVDSRFDAKGNTKRAIEPYVACDLTVIDDIGGEFSNQNRVEYCEEVLNALAGSGARILFTTNLTLAQLSNPKPAAQRIVGRIVEAGRLVAVTGKNYRQAVINETPMD